MNTSPTKEQMEYTQNNLFQIAKIALILQHFVALDNAEKGYITLHGRLYQ